MTLLTGVVAERTTIGEFGGVIVISIRSSCDSSLSGREEREFSSNSVLKYNFISPLG